MSDVSDIFSLQPHYVVMALCIPCSSRWIAVIQARTKLFNLECPECGACDSFASFIPINYSDEHLEQH